MKSRKEYLKKINDLLEEENYGDIDEAVSDMLEEIFYEVRNATGKLKNVSDAKDIMDKMTKKLY